MIYAITLFIYFPLKPNFDQTGYQQYSSWLKNKAYTRIDKIEFQKLHFSFSPDAHKYVEYFYVIFC